jgi:hypothetical protein
MDVSGQLHTLAALSSGKDPLVPHWIGGWGGPRAILEADPFLTLNLKNSFSLRVSELYGVFQERNYWEGRSKLVIIRYEQD